MNKEIGNYFEKKFIEKLDAAGFWCHLMAYKAEGQPCDVVALKDGQGMLADVKHCSANRFPFKDIQSNQITCFRLAREKGNKWLGFAIYFDVDQSWRWMDFSQYEYLARKGVKSVAPEDLEYLIYDSNK